MKAELNHFCFWLSRLAKWVLEPKRFWFAFGVLFLSAAVAVLLRLTEPVIRFTGLALQLLGISTVVWGIKETLDLFNHPLHWFAENWLTRFPRYKRSNIIAVAEGALAMAGGRARAYQMSNPPPNATVEERVISLENNIGHINNRINETLRELDESQRTQAEALAQERHERAEEGTQIRKQLEAVGTGGLHLSLIGALWLFVGVILSTASAELAQWLK